MQERPGLTSPLPAYEYSPSPTLRSPAAALHASPSGLLERVLGPALPAWRAIDPDGMAARAAEVPAQRSGAESVAWARAGLAAAPIYNAMGLPLSPFLGASRDEDYEMALLRRGAMAFRGEGYHDWFNLLCWRLWPRAKAALNLRHGLHYLARLRALHGGVAQTGRRVPRDRWMQRLANLDEGGGVARAGWLEAHTARDAHGVDRLQGQAPAAATDLWLFGHAALELVHQSPLSPEGGPGPALTRLRVFLLPLEELSDDLLAQRILTFSPELEPMIGPALAEHPEPQPFYCAALRFASADRDAPPGTAVGDPFAEPFRSLAFPFAQPEASPLA